MKTRRYRGHVPALDGVRGLAILLVLAHNLHEFNEPLSRVARIVSLAMNWGWVGVQLFFVLSGYLITGVLLDSRRAPNYFSAFYGRRALRIFPLYYTVLTVAFVILPLVLGHPIDGHQNQIWLWTYLINWAEPLGYGVPAFPVFWSLAVEEQFYLVWPWVVRALPSRRLGLLCVALAVVSAASRVLMLAYGATESEVYHFTISRLDALVLGGGAALLLRSTDGSAWIEARLAAVSWSALGLFLAGVLVTHGYPRAAPLSQTLGYSILALVFTVMIVATAVSHERDGTLSRLFSFAPLRSIGKYSYAMYVFHKFLHDSLGRPLVERWFPGSRSTVAVLYFIVMTAISYAAGWLSYQLLEKHFLRLKDRFAPME